MDSRIKIMIDPGDDTGWSKWEDRQLVSCGLCHPEDYPELPFVIGLPKESINLTIENPEVYSGNRQVDPNNLVTLGRKVGELLGVYRAYYHLLGIPLSYDIVLPKQWKGQVPKEIHHDRELPKLDGTEKRVLLSAMRSVSEGKRHNIKDAVCLGIWRHKR